MRAKLQEVERDLRRRWHQPVPEQGRWLGSVVRGYYAYHAVPTNVSALQHQWCAHIVSWPQRPGAATERLPCR